MKRDINNIKDDISNKKRIIEQMLYVDPDIIETINNPKIDPTCPDEIVFKNIFPFIRVPNTQEEAQNYITFTVDNNDVTNKQYVKFVVFVHQDLAATKWGIPRHDLLGYIIEDIFNLSNKLGMQLRLISNTEGSTDTNYCTRTLWFESTTTNSIKPYLTNPYEVKSIVGRHDKVVQRESV
jgi:hypothetical protein